MNSAFVFIKPHAVTDEVKAFVEDYLVSKGMRILSQNSLSAEVIDKDKLIDQHYYAIASKATLLKPSELNVPPAKFKDKFNLEWADALASGKVFNAMDASKVLGMDAEQLAAAWKEAMNTDKVVKFGGGFYCGLVEAEGKDPIYVFNAFFMSMRAQFTKPGTSIYYYVVEWDPCSLSWADFRGKVLGPTDPKKAPKDSLRGCIFEQWAELGLKAVPNVGENGVHASASPFEAFAERNNWLGVSVDSDAFSAQLLDVGVSEGTIKAWSVDPQVEIGGGTKASIFDQLEDLDSAECLLEIQRLHNLSEISDDGMSEGDDNANVPRRTRRRSTYGPTFLSFAQQKLGLVGVKNSAFVFIKPHAVTDQVKAFVEDYLVSKGMRILSQNSLSAEVIDKDKLIDKHYYAIASKATLLKPSELNVPPAKFKDKFNLEWADALASGKVFNAMDASEVLGMDAEQLAAAWAKAMTADKVVKFGGGFYCGLVEAEGKDPIYVFNAFFMSMRAQFTKPGRSIYYYVVEWDPCSLSWADFRGKVLGPTDPKKAPKDSLRGRIFEQWAELGLMATPNVGENGVHASASPFEAFAERNNWLGVPVHSDVFSAQLLDVGVSVETIEAWSVDPQVLIGDGAKASIFDQLEDLDSAECLLEIQRLHKLSQLSEEAQSEGGAKVSGRARRHSAYGPTFQAFSQQKRHTVSNIS